MKLVLLLLAVAASCCQASAAALTETPSARVAALLPADKTPLRLFPNDFDSRDQVSEVVT